MVKYGVLGGYSPSHTFTSATSVKIFTPCHKKGELASVKLEYYPIDNFIIRNVKPKPTSLYKPKAKKSLELGEPTIDE